jgi:hypothetical protein
MRTITPTGRMRELYARSDPTPVVVVDLFKFASGVNSAVLT